MEKLCVVCGNTLTGRHVKTCSKDCFKKYRKQYSLIFDKEYYRKNKKKILLTKKQWAIKNSDKIKKIKKRYSDSHKKENAVRSKEFRTKNKERILETARRWASNNKEKLRAIKKRSIAKNRPKTLESHTLRNNFGTSKNINILSKKIIAIKRAVEKGLSEDIILQINQGETHVAYN